ncbi:MAG: methyltransferase domain-containing protein [Thermoplasmata archaeon]
MSETGLAQFHELATYYDAINDWKDYRGETRRLEAIARRYGRPGKTAWLDVACGTGRHLEYLSRSHFTTGLDGSRDMLRLARRRLPRVRLVLGDMRSFRIRRQFDVVSCLFSAIGHLDTKEDVRKAFANFARHVKDDGVVIVEPWISPNSFRPGAIHLRSHQSPGLTVVRLAFSRRRGNHSQIHYHYLIGEPGREIRHLEETDDGLLLSREELQDLMRSVGLKPYFFTRGLTRGRGLLVGVRGVVRTASKRQPPAPPR